MPYEVINLDTDEGDGVVYETLADARHVARKLRAYAIWRISLHCGDWQPEQRVEYCEPYDGDDDRAKQGLGQWNASEIPDHD
jgi:hypothetical protein